MESHLVLPVLCLMSQCDLTRLCGLISPYNNIIELLIQTPNKIASEFSI